MNEVLDNHQVFKSAQIKIDKTKKRYKKLFSFLFVFSLSEGWKHLPEITSVSITSRKMNQTFNSVRAMGNSSTVQFGVIVVYLMTTSKQKVEAGRFENIKKAQKFANDLASYLTVDIIDYTKREEGN